MKNYNYVIIKYLVQLYIIESINNGGSNYEIKTVNREDNFCSYKIL